MTGKDESTSREIKSLAASIGICYDTEMSKFGWYLEQCARSELPVDWTKEFDPQGEIYYYNKKDERIRKVHPSINTFRKFFSQFVE